MGQVGDLLLERQRGANITGWNQYTLTIAGSVAAAYLNGIQVCAPSTLAMVPSDVGTVPITFGQDLGTRFLHG